MKDLKDDFECCLCWLEGDESNPIIREALRLFLS